MAKLAKYELLAKIASGGMAEIYVARSRAASEGVCVVKKLLPQHASNEDFIQMFLDEGRVSAMFDHPNIVRMYDFGSEDGSYYLAMEYLHGEDVRTVLRTLRAHGRTVPLPVAVSLMIEVCAGLHHAHEMNGPNGEPLGIVHRDVSPHNIFVGFDGSVKLVDFGIAKSTDRKWETRHGTLKGKVPYMAPEQIKGRNLDRRVDLYAVGVLLYELVLGRRPYIVTTTGDFAMMMAIARHDIRSPSTVDPNIAPDLEQIILGAMAYDPKARFPTAKALHDELVKFARDAGLDTSPSLRAAFLEELFEAHAREWREAQRAASDLAAHVVHIEEERAQTEIHDEPEEATEVDGSETPSSASTAAPYELPLGSAASLVASTSAAVASVVELFGVTVVTLHGRIDESFDGAALGQSLSGTVMFDMAGVERITSFGVRAWLEMMAAIDEDDDVDVYLARCSEAVVTQLSMIKSFAGRAKVVSFDVPFLCDDCGNTFVRTLDCGLDAAVIAEQTPPSSTCPRCGGEAKLDDDPAYLAFAVPYAGRPVPERLRVVLERQAEVARGGLDAVDKVITASETRVRVHRDVDPAFRWNRVLDGLEGAVVVDFRGATRFAQPAAIRFASAIGSLGSEVTSCEIVECPVEVAAALASVVARGRVHVGSVAFEGRCASCAAARTGAVAVRALEDAYRSGAALFVPCRRCNGALALGDIAPALNALFASGSRVALPGSRGAPLPLELPTASGHGDASAAAHAEVSPGSTLELPTAYGHGDASAAAHAEASQVPSSDPVEVGVESARLAPVAVPRGPSSPRSGAAVAAVAACVALLAVVIGIVALRRSMAHRLAATAAAMASPSAAAPPPSEPEPPLVERRADGIYVVVAASGPDEDVALTRARADAIVRLLPLLEADLDPAVRTADVAAGEARDGDEATAARFVDQVGTFASPDRVDVKRRPTTTAAEAAVIVTYRVSTAAWQRAVAYYSTVRATAGVTFAPAFPSRGPGLVVVTTDRTMTRALPAGSLVALLDGRPATSLESLSSLHRGLHVASYSSHGERLGTKLNVK